MENLGFGFMLMGIGMVTVFVILLIVIFGSDLMIRLINKIAPEEAPKAVKKSDDAPVAVLEAAVAQITGGRGHITKITKIN